MVVASISIIREIFMCGKTCVQFNSIFPFFDKNLLRALSKFTLH